jgi:hypothetical protein
VDFFSRRFHPGVTRALNLLSGAENQTVNWRKTFAGVNFFSFNFHPRVIRPKAWNL